jgi:hypothetical protein
MNSQLFKEIVEKQCYFLTKDKFALRMVDSRNFWYEKSTDDVGYIISFFLTEYGDTFHVMGLMAEKRFNIVEQHIQSVLNDVKLDTLYTIHKSPDTKWIPPDLAYDYNYILKEFEPLKGNRTFNF